MFRVIVLAIALTVVLADGDKKKCARLFHPETMRCCKNDVKPQPPPDMTDDFKECFKMPHGHHSCEHDICMAKKRGFASDDGTIDMDAYEKIITEDFKTNPSLVEAIKETCIKGDISKFGPPDACQLFKLKICTHKTAVLDCKEWYDEGPCAGIKDLVMECAKMDE